MPESPGLHELIHLYEKLSPEQRDELLQSLFTAAPRGGEAMIRVLEKLLLWPWTNCRKNWLKGSHNEQDLKQLSDVTSRTPSEATAQLANIV